MVNSRGTSSRRVPRGTGWWLLAIAIVGTACGGGGGGGGTTAEFAFVEFRLDGASHVARNAPLEFRFNSRVDPGSVTPAALSVLRPDGSPFPGRVVVERDTITFYPTVFPGDRNDFPPGVAPPINGLGFSPNTRYRVRLLGGSPLGLRNVRGRIMEFSETLDFATGFNFVPEDVPVFPVVEAVEGLGFEPAPIFEGDPLDPDPTRQPLVTPRLSWLTVHFSEPMDPRSFDPLASFTVTNVTKLPDPLPGLGEPIPGSVQWSADAKSFRFHFSFSLGDDPFGPAPFEFVVAITESVTDLAGNRLSMDENGIPFPDGRFRYFFTTADRPGEPNYETFVESFETIVNLDPTIGPPTAKWFGNGILEGGDVRSRFKDVRDQRPLFNLADPLVAGPVADPGEDGSHFQMLYYSDDIGSLAPGELLIGMSWRPKSRFSFPSTYRDMQIVLSHKVGGSSLSPGYAANLVDPLLVFRGDYEILTDFDVDWQPWPEFSSPFPYDGERGLVFDVIVPPGADTFQLFENTSTSSVPRRRNIGPWTAPQASNSGENTTYPVRFEIVRVETVATSRWQDTEIELPDYLDPIVDFAPDRPGTDAILEWQGAHDDGNGGPGETSPWVPILDQVDGYQYFRFRATMIGDPVTTFVPALRSLSVVYEFR